MDNAVDYSDPCARFSALQTAYFAALSGGTVQKVRFKDGDNEQEVAYGPGRGSIKDLRAEMNRAEDECLRKCGKKPRRRRFAMIAGVIPRPDG